MPLKVSHNIPTDAATGASQERPSSWTFQDFAALGALLCISAFLGLSALRARPDLYRGAYDVLFSDTGYTLLVVERLLEGDRLYSEVAFQYGAVPALLHAAVARLFGNTLSTLHLLLLALSLVNVALAYALIRSCSSRLTALLTVGLGLTASMLIPGSLLGSFSNTNYIALERTLILLGCLLWTPPLARTRKQAVLLGLVIGTWQGVRFGGGVFLGVAIVLADMLALWWAASDYDRAIGRYARVILWTLTAALLIEALIAAVALMLLPRQVAWDFLWPTYILDSYESWVTPDVRWPTLGGFKTLVGQYLTPIFGAGVAIGAIAWYTFRGDRLSDEQRAVHADRIKLLIPFFFFVLGVVGLFRMAFHFFQFAWALVVPIAWLLHLAQGWKKAVVAAVMLPCFFLSFRAQISANKDPGQVSFEAPNGEELWASTDAIAELVTLTEHLSLEEDSSTPPAADREALLFLPLGAGFHVLYDVDSPLRQSWFMKGFIRPYDEPELIASLDETRAVIVRGSGTTQLAKSPCAWFTPAPLSSDACNMVAARLGPPERVGQFWVFPVRPTGAPAAEQTSGG